MKFVLPVLGAKIKLTKPWFFQANQRLWMWNQDRFFLKLHPEWYGKFKQLQKEAYDARNKVDYRLRAQDQNLIALEKRFDDYECDRPVHGFKAGTVLEVQNIYLSTKSQWKKPHVKLKYRGGKGVGCVSFQVKPEALSTLNFTFVENL